MKKELLILLGILIVTAGLSNAEIVNVINPWVNSSYVTDPPSPCATYSAISGFNTNFSSATCVDSWVNIDGDTMTGNLAMGAKNITNVSVNHGDNQKVRFGDSNDACMYWDGSSLITSTVPADCG